MVVVTSVEHFVYLIYLTSQLDEYVFEVRVVAIESWLVGVSKVEKIRAI